MLQLVILWAVVADGRSALCPALRVLPEVAMWLSKASFVPILSKCNTFCRNTNKERGRIAKLRHFFALVGHDFANKSRPLHRSTDGTSFYPFSVPTIF